MVLGNRNRKAHLTAARALIALARPPIGASSLEELIDRLTGIDITTCLAAIKEKCACWSKSPITGTSPCRGWLLRLKRRFPYLIFKTQPICVRTVNNAANGLIHRALTRSYGSQQAIHDFERTSNSLKKHAYRSLPIPACIQYHKKHSREHFCWRLRTSPFYQ